MGKRKKSSRKPQGPKKKDPLPTSFACLFCNHEKSVAVKLDKKLGIGQLSCKVCGQRYQTGINYLSAAVDVYSDWIDACDSVAKDAAGSNNRDGSSTGRGLGQTTTSSDTGGFGGGDLDDDEEVVQEEEYDVGF